MKPPKRRRRLLLATPCIGFAALILILSSRPATDLPSTGVAQADKLLHAVEYLVFGLLLLLPVRGLGWRGRFPAFVVGVVFASLDESLQTYIPGRFGDAADFVMDVVGLLAALAVDLTVEATRTAAKGS